MMLCIDPDISSAMIARSFLEPFMICLSSSFLKRPAFHFPYTAVRTKANHAQIRNVRRSAPPMIACHSPVVRGMFVGTSHRSARQRSVRSVSIPTITTTPNVMPFSGMGAQSIRKRYRTSEVVQARTMRARLVRNSENPKNLGAMASMGANSMQMPIKHFSIVTGISWFSCCLNSGILYRA